MNFPTELVEVFKPDANALLDYARPRTDDLMLQVIAEADYGMNASERLAELRPIRDDGLIPKPMQFWTREVLELTRWSDPDEADQLKDRFFPSAQITWRQRHMTRLFVCAVLLRAAEDPETECGDDAYEEMLAFCLDSTRVLGEQADHSFASFLSWRLFTRCDDHNAVPLALSLLVIATRMCSTGMAERVLKVLCKLIPTLDDQSRQHVGPYYIMSSDAYDFTNQIPSIKDGRWDLIAEELKRRADLLNDKNIQKSCMICRSLFDIGWFW